MIIASRCRSITHHASLRSMRSHDRSDDTTALQPAKAGDPPRQGGPSGLMYLARANRSSIADLAPNLGRNFFPPFFLFFLVF
jgi:hypothetical protein